MSEKLGLAVQFLPLPPTGYTDLDTVRLLFGAISAPGIDVRGEVNAVLWMFIDWKQAYSRQCHTLGVESFIKNGVRPSIIPLLISYFQDRQMRVKWHGEISEPRRIPGGGAIGASLGNWEFSSQTNNNADCVPEEDRFKFVDDLSTLEVINLLTVGLSSLYTRPQVPSDLLAHGQFVESTKLKSQSYLDQINEWTVNQKMVISKKKTRPCYLTYI